MRTAGRFFTVALFTVVALALRAAAQSAATDITGVYHGSYDGPQGTTRFELSLTEQEGRGRLTGVFTSHLAGNFDAVVSTNELAGFYAGPSHRFQLRSNITRTAPPGNREMLVINGTCDPTTAQLSGMIMMGRSSPIKFEADRDATESAKLPAAASTAPEAARAVPPRSRAVTPIVPPTATRPVAQAVAPTLPPLDAPKLSAPADITGIFTGHYLAGNNIAGNTSQILKLKLQLRKSGNGDLSGVFTFYVPTATGLQEFRFAMNGSYDAATGKVSLEARKQVWVKPYGYTMTGLEGTFDPSAGRLAGNLTAGNRGPFEVVRNEAETEKAATAINGVYTDSINPWSRPPPVGLKLSLKGATNGAVIGFLTLDLPPELGSRATYKLDGTYSMENEMWTIKAAAWGPPAPHNYVVTGIQCRIDPRTNSISGILMANWASPTFVPQRDAAASANLDGVMAAQSEQATNPVLVAQYAKLAGAVTGQSATNSLIMVIICRDDPPGGLTGLPVPDHAATSAKTAVNDGDWIARLIQRLKEHAQGRQWDVRTPSASENHICAYLNVGVPYNFKSSNAVAAVASIWKLTDEIPKPAGLRINSINANPPPTPAQIAAAKAREERLAALRAAPPAQLASPGLVRKSKAYWDNYETDLIREVFDGGFGRDVNDNLQFQMLFTSYVEMFSKNCGASLPAHHESVTMTQTKVQTDRYGNVIREDTLLSWTVECDSRFASYYRKYVPALQQSGAWVLMTTVAGRGSLSTLTDPATDIARFFATEKCGSAALRQLGENLLRGATGDRSLQQAGEKIAGAAAETDKDLPPGRYARFVDGCNGFYRDPATARGDHTAWCDCLAKKYQYNLPDDSQESRVEEYYYANDYQRRFLDEIAQLKQGTDPNWPRMHPACNDCRQ